MDMFDRVANEVGGANIRTINTDGSVPQPRQRRVQQSPQPMEIMSDDALRKLDDTLQRKFQSAHDARSRNIAQNQIYAVQAEIAKRQSIEDQKPIEVISPNEQERIKGFIINKFRGDKNLLNPGLKFCS